MPSASPELAEQWPGMDEEAISYLEERGFTLTRQWTWVKPTQDHKCTNRENSAIDYLCEEWDFGGVEGEDHPIGELSYDDDPK